MGNVCSEVWYWLGFSISFLALGPGWSESTAPACIPMVCITGTGWASSLVDCGGTTTCIAYHVLIGGEQETSWLISPAR